VVGAPLLDLVGDLGDPVADDVGQPGVIDRVPVCLRDHPGVRDTVTSASWWAAMNDSMVGIIVVVTALFPSNDSTINGKPVASVSSPTVICGLQPAFLGEPGFTEPVPLVGLEVQRGHVIQHQRRRPQRGVPRARRRQALSPVIKVR
jgi:hypothetical protein